MFKKGEKAYSIDRRGKEAPEEVTIVSVGKKFITVEDAYGKKIRFDRETGIREDWGQYEIYESKELYEEQVQKREMVKEAIKLLEWNQNVIPLNALTLVLGILKDNCHVKE